MKQDNIVIITRPKICLYVKCPNCNNKFNSTIKVEAVKCNKCGNKFLPEKKIDILSFFLSIIYRKFETKNEVIVSASDFYLPNLLSIKYHFDNVNLGVEVHEIEKKSLGSKYICEECSYCMDCVECANCGLHYPKEKRLCPKCKHKEVFQTWFKGKDECRYCKSKNLKEVVVFGDKCRLCGSKKFKEVEHDKTNIMTISKIRAFKKEA